MSKSQSRTKAFLLQVRLTETQRDCVQQQADRMGCTVPVYVRALMDEATGRVPRLSQADTAHLYRLLAEVNKIGGNINQMSKKANIHGMLPTMETLEDVRRTLLKVQDALTQALPPR